MKLHIEAEISEMLGMTISQLRQKYQEVFGETTNSRNKPWLRRRIIWQMQANIEGHLSKRARTKARELADERFLNGKLPGLPEIPPRKPGGSQRDSRLPKPGSQITRRYKGKSIVVTVMENDFIYLDQQYSSLSAVAKAATGSHWNGYNFFRLNSKVKS